MTIKTVLTCAVAVAMQVVNAEPVPAAEAAKPAMAATKKSRAAARPALSPLIIRDRNSDVVVETTMYMGEATTFLTPDVARVAVGNGSIISATAIDEREVLVFGSAVGVSSLTVWDKDGRYASVKITVVPADTSRLLREVSTFLRKIPQASAEVVGDKVIVEGDSLSDLDLAKIEELGKRYPQIVNFTNRLGWEQMILLDVKVVEFPTTYLRDVGLKWTGTGGAAIGAVWAPVRYGHAGPYQINIQTGQNTPPPITDPGSTDTVTLPVGLNILGGMNLGINAQLNLLAQEGKASILAEPQLSARNGSKATFLAGGEYPYTVSTINGPTVQFKPYGIKLDIVPRVDRTGVVRATIDSEVSAIDTSISTSAGPALTSRKTSTEFNVKNGETLVLAGLISRRTSTSIDKVPFLGDIPLLGALFSSKRFQNDETELVVFVTPTVVDSRSAGLVDRVERSTERLQQDATKPPYLPHPLEKPAPPPQQPVAPDAQPSSQQTLGDRVAATDPPSLVPGRYRVMLRSLGVRDRPNTAARITRHLALDSVVEVLPEEPMGPFSPVLVDGEKGWVATRWLVLAQH